MTLEIRRTGTGECWIAFAPALSKRTEVVAVELNGRALHFTLDQNIDDQHLRMRFPISGASSTVVIRFKNDFGLSLANELPALGSASGSLRFLDESWNDSRDQLTLELSGVAGKQYEVAVWNPVQIALVKGGVLTKEGQLLIQMQNGPAGTYVLRKVLIVFQKH